MELTLTIHRATGAREDIKVLSRIDTLDEIEYYKAGGILQYVLRGLAKQA
jgi:aconitate hydratase